jgi:Tfp pilus assembly protein PilV
MTSATGNRGRAGLALLEVLVAVAIFFGGIAAVLHAFASAAAAIDAAAETRRADALLRERLADLELQAQGENALPAAAEGAFEQAAGYRWAVRSSRLPGAEGETRTEWTVSVWREGSPRRHTVCTWLAGEPP